MKEHVVERFAQAGIPEDKISCEPDTFVFKAPVSPTELLGWFRDYYGPTMNAFESAAKDGRQDTLFDELNELFNAQNASSDPDSSAIPATYLRVNVQA
jgi:hypothetical protein